VDGRVAGMRGGEGSGALDEVVERARLGEEAVILRLESQDKTSALPLRPWETHYAGRCQGPSGDAN